MKKDALSYFDESFSPFQLFIASLYAKFKHYHRKMLTELFTDYERTKYVVAEGILLISMTFIVSNADQQQEESLLHVAAYCRVSTDEIEQTISIEIQKRNYREKMGRAVISLAFACFSQGGMVIYSSTFAYI